MGLSHELTAQLIDKKWVMGDWYNGQQVIVDYNKTPPTVTLNTTTINFGCGICPTISNEQGEIQFFTNGRLVMDRNGEMMENGDSIPPGMTEIGNPPPEIPLHGIPNTSFILPDFSNPDIYHYFYIDFLSDTPNDYWWTSLYSLKIDMSMNNGLGKVIEKNTPILLKDSTRGFVCFTPVRHANGRDWWILTNESKTNVYHRLLWTPNGMIDDFDTFTVDGPAYNDMESSMIIGFEFSVDGSKYIVGNGFEGWVYDFNRCTGLLSNPVQLFTVNNPPYHNWINDMAISRNNRYAFSSDENSVTGIAMVRRYDLWSTDPSTLVDTIIDNTSSLSPPGDLFQLPTGQLALSSPNKRFFHTLPYADSQAIVIDTNYIEWDYDPLLPGSLRSTTPVNYYLGPIDGSSCDSLGIDNHPLAYWRYDRRPNPLEIKFVDLTYYEPTYWNWDFGDGQSSTEQHPLHLFAQAGTYEVCLIAGNQYAADTLCKMVTVGDLLAVNIVADTLSGCMPLQVQYHAQTTDANSLQWTFSGGTPSQSDQADVLVTYDTAGFFPVVLTASGTFGNKTDSQVVTVLPIPKADYQFSIDGLEITTTNTSLNATHFLWDFGDGLTDTTFSPTHTFAGAGSYNINLIAFNDCGSDTLSRNLLITSSLSPDKEFAFSIYPNPNNGTFNIELFGKHPDKIELQIFDLLGRPIWQRSWLNRKYLHTEINLQKKSHIPAGQYIYQLQYGEGRIIGMFLVE